MNLNLEQFNGTETYYRYSPLSPFLLTDGAKYVATKTNCLWLFDLIDSYIIFKMDKKRRFIVTKLSVNASKTADFKIEDGDFNTLFYKGINHTNFPLDKIEIWSQYGSINRDSQAWVHMLPSEY